LGLGVHFGQNNLSLKGRRSLGKGLSHHFARPAPGRPEIDQHRQGGTGDEALEGLVRKFDRMGGQKGGSAFRADRVLADAFGQDGVDGPAVRADGMYFFHEVGLRFVVCLELSGNKHF
jgi:hypothetical protein